MKRKIIEIDDTRCNGCGNCITGCAEGALQLMDGKAKLVKEQFCDGFGDCIGTCPTGALTIVEREADEFDEEATKQHLLHTQGGAAVQRMEAANAAHEPGRPPLDPPSGGCPGTRMRMPAVNAASAMATPPGSGPRQAISSELRQWPVQLHLVQPGAPFFKQRELLVCSTCAPIASADVHWRYLRGRSVVVACPKLDRTDGYVEKLAQILAEPSIPRVVILRMEVPCCGGLTRIVQAAAAQSGRSDLEVCEVIVETAGDIPAATSAAV